MDATKQFRKKHHYKININSLMNEIKKGDNVRAKFGKASMTVVRFVGDEKEDELVFINARGFEKGDVICEWLDRDSKKQYNVFKKDSLELIEG